MQISTIVSVLILSIITHSQNIFACSESLKAYPKECSIQDDYTSLVRGFGKHDVNPEETTEARSLRFIARKDFNKAIKKNQTMHPWKLYKPAPKTWLKWEEGTQYRKFVNDDIDKKKQTSGKWELTKEHLKYIHRNTITPDLTGKLDKMFAIRHLFPRAGEFRKLGHLTSGFFVSNSWKLSKDEKEKLDNYDLKCLDGAPIVRSRLLNIPLIGIIGEISYLRSKLVEKEINKLLDEVNKYVNLFLEGKKLPISPIQFMADIQRKYISIHPFHEGNGRISRYIQDILSSAFKLPPVPAGDLQNDVINKKDEYRKETVDAMLKKTHKLRACLAMYDNNLDITGRCRPLYKSTKYDNINEKKEKKIFFSLLKSNFKTIKLKEGKLPQPKNVVHSNVEIVPIKNTIALETNNAPKENTDDITSSESNTASDVKERSIASDQNPIANKFKKYSDHKYVINTPENEYEVEEYLPEVKRKDIKFNLSDCVSILRANHTVLTETSGELVKKCQPDTLFTWINNNQMLGWKAYSKLGFIGKKWPKFLPSQIFTARTPLASHGYGPNQIRLKLKDGVKFVYPQVGQIDSKNNNGQDAGYDWCKNHPKETNTIVVRSKYVDENKDDAIAEYIMCSPSVIHSWSTGTKKAYNEMVRHYDSVENNKDSKTPQYELYAQGQNTDLHLELDKMDFSRKTLFQKFKNLKDKLFRGNGKIHYGSGVRASKDNQAFHITTDRRTEWNPIKRIDNLPLIKDALKDNNIDVKSYDNEKPFDYYNENPEVLEKQLYSVIENKYLNEDRVQEHKVAPKKQGKVKKLFSKLLKRKKNKQPEDLKSERDQELENNSFYKTSEAKYLLKNLGNLIKYQTHNNPNDLVNKILSTELSTPFLTKNNMDRIFTIKDKEIKKKVLSYIIKNNLYNNIDDIINKDNTSENNDLLRIIISQDSKDKRSILETEILRGRTDVVEKFLSLGLPYYPKFKTKDLLVDKNTNILRYIERSNDYQDAMNNLYNSKNEKGLTQALNVLLPKVGYKFTPKENLSKFKGNYESPELAAVKLIESGADISKVTVPKKSVNLFGYAIDNGYESIRDAILSSKNKKHLYNQISNSKVSGHMRNLSKVKITLSNILRKENKDTTTLLEMAISNNNTQFAIYLLEMGASPDYLPNNIIAKINTDLSLSGVKDIIDKLKKEGESDDDDFNLFDD